MAVAKRPGRSPGLGNVTGRKNPTSPRPKRPGVTANNPGGRERRKPIGGIGTGRPGKGGKVGTWASGSLTKTKRPGKVAKPRRLKKQVMY